MSEAIDIGTRFHSNDGKFVVQRGQDCTAILESCKAQQASGQVGSSDVKLAAKLPFVIVENYCNVNGVSFAEVMAPNSPHIRRMLNDKSLAGFRVWQGNI